MYIYVYNLITNTQNNNINLSQIHGKTSSRLPLSPFVCIRVSQRETTNGTPSRFISYCLLFAEIHPFLKEHFSVNDIIKSWRHKILHTLKKRKSARKRNKCWRQNKYAPTSINAITASQSKIHGQYKRKNLHRESSHNRQSYKLHK